MMLGLLAILRDSRSSIMEIDIYFKNDIKKMECLENAHIYKTIFWRSSIFVALSKGHLKCNCTLDVSVICGKS